MEDLADRDAAEAVRTRLYWKYALGLDIGDEGFDFSVLSEFRDRLAVDGRAMRLLEAMLDAASEAGLLRRGGRSRTGLHPRAGQHRTGSTGWSWWARRRAWRWSKSRAGPRLA